MWDQFARLASEGVQYMHRLDREHWLFIFVGVMILGFTCMRGFGSRANY